MLSASCTLSGQNLLCNNLILHQYQPLGTISTPEALFLEGTEHNGAVVSNSSVKYEYLTSTRHGLALRTSILELWELQGLHAQGILEKTLVLTSLPDWEESGNMASDEDKTKLL